MLNLLICLTIMINPATLSTKLAGLVGFRQPYNPEYHVLDAANQASRSGLYVTDNPFVKIESIKDSQDYSGITEVGFNEFLRNKLATSAVNVANAVFSDNDYIDRQLIYIHAANKFKTDATGYTYDLPPGFSCYWIKVSRDKDIAFKIKRVLLEFEGTGDITLHLFNTSNVKVPLFSKTITVSSPFQEEELDWICDNSAGKGYKGDYYLGYFSEGVTLKPFKREYRDAVCMAEIKNICYTRSNFPLFTSLDAGMDLNSFNSYLQYNGINPDITVYEDFTDLMVQNEKLFARAIQIDCQIALLSESVASLRSNRNERISAQYTAQVMAQIEGENGEGNVKVKGLRPQFYGSIAKIKKEISKLRTGYLGAGQILVQTLT